MPDQTTGQGIRVPTVPAETPFGVGKSAEQLTQLSVDPSQGMTKSRYGWYSNGSLFDSSLLSAVEAGIRLETTATGTDEVRIRSAYPGQYVSGALAQPGLGRVVDDSNIIVDGNGRVTLSHGEIISGAFIWDPVNSEVYTGVANKIDTTGWKFIVKSLGSHIGDSPILQQNWNTERFDRTDDSSVFRTPADGGIENFPFTWYNEGALSNALIDPNVNELKKGHNEVIDGRPSTDTANFPVQLVARNAGTASQLGVELGGMQYKTFGASREDLSTRPTPEARITSGSYISPSVTLADNSPDPLAEPGVPLISLQRQDGESTLDLQTVRVEMKATNDSVFVYIWDEWEPGTALAGATFDEPNGRDNTEDETKIDTDTTATDYTPTNYILRDYLYFQQGNAQGNSLGQVTENPVETRVPMEATRVFTAVNEGDSNAGANPFKVSMVEGY